MIASPKLDRLAPSVHGPVKRFLQLVDAVFGKELVAVICRGRVLRNDFDPSHHSIATILILKRIDLEHLKSLSAKGSTLGSYGFSAPLVMTRDSIEDSRDTFPLELIDVHLNHHAIVGEDPFGTLTFDPSHVRLQCERDIRGLMLNIRQALLASGGIEFLLSDVQHDIGDHLIRTLRGYLWINGHNEDLPREHVLEETEKLLGSKLTGLRHAVEEAGNPTWDDFKTLYQELDALSRLVDTHDTTATGAVA